MAKNKQVRKMASKDEHSLFTFTVEGKMPGEGASFGRKLKAEDHEEAALLGVKGFYTIDAPHLEGTWEVLVTKELSLMAVHYLIEAYKGPMVFQVL
ncbi:MAG: hypothetical protein ACXABY_17090 [Candidatus Thorarchaeota archaeon]|jgi:hypothetical protein